jgi:hypothetical protein
VAARRFRLIAAATVAATAMLAAPAGARTHARVLVTSASAATLPAGARFVAELAPGLRAYALDAPHGLTATAFARRLRGRPGVLAAQADAPLRRSAFFNVCADAPTDVVTNPAAPVGAVGVDPPAQAPTIAVLDSGVDAGAPGLAGRVLPGYDATTGGTADTDGDGHGTQVAAVAAAAPGLFQGISPTSAIFPVRIYNQDDSTSAQWIVEAIQKAVKAGAKVINISGSNPRSAADGADVSVVGQAIAAAYAQGVITVVAAGNEGKSDPTIPGSFPHVLDVGSAGLEGDRNEFSNFGPFLDLVTPADRLLVPAPAGVCPSGFGTATGTSFSAPAVAGAVALLGAKRPELSTQQLFDLVRTGAVRDVGAAGRDDETGFGLLDVAAGLSAKAPRKEATELDDDVFWLTGAYRKKHPPFLAKTARATVKGHVSSSKDPQDVLPVTLRKGQTLTAAVKTAGGLVGLGIWSGDTGPFDISAGRDDELLADSGGLTEDPVVRWKAQRTGRYYVSVEAPDVPTQAEIDAAGTPLQLEQDYTLSLRRSGPSAKSKRRGR